MLSACVNSWGPVFYNFWGVFEKAIIPLAFVENEMFISNSASRASLATYYLLYYYYYYYYYKITEPLRALSLADKRVKMRVFKHGCDVSDLRILFYKSNRTLFLV